jgi:predicted nucleotidyltransferase
MRASRVFGALNFLGIHTASFQFSDYQKMRISQEQRNVIINTVRGAIPDAQIFLFGSRADDSKRGGDIDLYVETRVHLNSLSVARLRGDIEDALEIKVDVVVNDHHKNEPIYEIAKRTGIVLT